MNSEPLIEKNGTPASPATARASSVLPVPGGPISRTPLGTRAPSRWNFFGFLRNSTISCRSFFTFQPGDVVERDAGAFFGIAAGGAAEDAREHAAAKHLVASSAGHVPAAKNHEAEQNKPNEREQIGVVRCLGGAQRVYA